MNSIQAIDYALTAISSYSKRLSNAGSIKDANDAQDTLRALQDILLEHERDFERRQATERSLGQP